MKKKYKVQAVDLAKDIGAGKAAKDLGIPVDTLYGKVAWRRDLGLAHPATQ